MTATQFVEGITSKVLGSDNLHYIFWDLDNCNQNQAEKNLKTQQKEHNLSDIFILNDKIGSYRAICFSKRSFQEYLTILHENKYVDLAFIEWTEIRKKATIRLGKKVDREESKIVKKLYGFEEVEIPKELEHVRYETKME